MADKKPKRPEFMTPKAIASYPRLVIPDTKFNAKGTLGLRLVLPVADAKAIRTNAEPVMAAFIAEDIKTTAEAAAKSPKIKKTLAAKKAAGDFKMSVEDQLDEAGEPTGNMLVAFKQSATSTFMDNGIETTRKHTIPLFDSKGKQIKTHDEKGNLLPQPIQVWSGSQVKVRYQVIPAFIAASESYHATLRPIAVQIIELVSGTGGARSASDYGFEAEEGFEAGSEVTSPVASEAGAGGDVAEDGSGY